MASSSMTSSGPSGRSPYPSRSRQRRFSGGEVDESGSAAPSPFLMLQSRISPTPSTPSTRRPRRFFDSSVSHQEGGGVLGTAIPQAKEGTNASAVKSSRLSSSSATTMDGVNLEKLRSLAQEALGTASSTASPSMAVFYASLVYSKTKSLDDAYRYGQALFQNGEAKRAVKLLESAGLFHQTDDDKRLEAILLAAQALASLGEWPGVLTLLEDASQHEHSRGPLEDEDTLAWQSFCIHTKATASLHPVARLCLWRGRAYAETGHAQRAALYWKRALQLDPKCTEALECLLGKGVIAPKEAHELILSLKLEPDMGWLLQFYLARIDLSPQADNDESMVDNNSNNNHTVDQPFFFPGNEASSIHMSTPSMLNNKIGNTPAVLEKTPRTPSLLQADVDTAFDKLWNFYKFQQSSAVLAMAARRAYRRYDLQGALKVCQELEASDPLCQTAGFVFVSTLVALGHKRLLFRLSHEWVEAAPKSARAWFAVGAYYYACKRYRVAQRHFCRATRLDPQCTEAWIAFGCSFAACDESDQALASFRAAQRLAPGEHASLLYMGMEYLRTNHLVLAQHFLTAAYHGSGGDPLSLHELGVLAYHRNDYALAIHWFGRALQSLQGDEDRDSGLIVEENSAIELCHDVYWEPTLFNLGQCYRKTKQYATATRCFERCLALCPDNASSYAALAFTKHLMGDLDGAIDYYHQSLSWKPDDPFSTDMLYRAFSEVMSDKLILEPEQQPPTAAAPSASYMEGESIMTADDGMKLSVDTSMGEADMSMGWQ